MNIDVLKSEWSEYELLDSGNRLKLERFGDAVVVRSEPKAWWSPSAPELWTRAHARHIDDDRRDSHWRFDAKVSAPVLDWNGVKFRTKFMDGTKHLGVFPEQSPHWQYIAKAASGFRGQGKPKLLHGGCDARGGKGRLFYDARRRIEAVGRMGAQEPVGERARVRADPLDCR